MLVNSIDDLDQLPPGTQLTYLHSQSGSTWLGLSPAEMDARVSVLLAAGYELPPPTVLPDIPDPEPQPQPLDASVAALTPGTDANIVFSWMATLAATNPAVSVARGDINLNLLGLGPLWASNRPMASMGLDVAFGMLWAAVPDAPEGYDAIVAAWRAEFHLTAG